MNIVIVEDNKDMCKLMTSYFKEETDINVSGVANNGIDGLKLIEQNMPDVALIDIILPGKDGLALLEDLNNLGILNNSVKCIVITAISSDEITAKAFSLGAKYVMLKPCDLSSLSRRIKELNTNEINIIQNIIKEEPNEEKTTKINLEKRVTSILNEIGIMPNLKGYKYLRSAIMMSFENENLLDGITKFLYPDIAKENRTTCTRVERAIRHALESAWDKGNGPAYYKILGYNDMNNGKRPTNSEFIASMVDFLKLNKI